MKASLTETGGVLVLHKTLDILESIREMPSGVKLSDLARAVDMPKATVYRILATLESRGLLDRVEGGGYRVAQRLFDLPRPFPMEEALHRIAPPLMEELAKSTRETVNLGILQGGEAVFTHSVESFESVRMPLKPDNRRLLHTTALGKVLLAALPEKDVQRLIRLKGLPRLTPYSIVSSIALMRELERVRHEGYAIEDQENELGGRCIGAPIAGPDGRAVAALSVSGPLFRMDLNRALWLTAKVKLTCASISAAALRERPLQAVAVR
jgi:DNA-binding IclR family transcriptional regulator